MQIRDLWPQCVANLYVLPTRFWITQIFYFILFSYKDQTSCQHVVWHDVTHTKTRFEGLKLLDFRFLQQVFDSTLLKNHVNLKLNQSSLKCPK